MKYDFTTIHNRKNMDAIAVDPKEMGWAGVDVDINPDIKIIPMWVADMNFPTCPTITEALIRRAEHPLFGYFSPKQEYYDSIINWHLSRNNVKNLKAEHIGYENGVLGGVISALNVLSSKGGSVMLHSPTYIGFTNVLANAGYDIVLSPLKKDSDNIWRMDFEDMEDKIKAKNIHAMVFCSPHNPTGRVWERGEIEELTRLCQKYDVYIISDEIWSDIILPPNTHIPTQSVNDWARENTVAMYAPSKTFNLAGLIGSYHIIYNKWLRDRIDKESSLCAYNSMNVLAQHALIGAYKPEGMEWVDELRSVIKANVDTACDFFEKIDGVNLSRPQGTYMIFPDFTDWLAKRNMNINELIDKGIKAGVLWQPGEPFHGENNIRINLASPESMIKEAFERLKLSVFA